LCNSSCAAVLALRMLLARNYDAFMLFSEPRDVHLVDMDMIMLAPVGVIRVVKPRFIHGPV
jgi:hypothetical protein